MNKFEDEIIEFLCKEENLRTSLEICSRIAGVKLRLHNEFWSSFDIELKMKLENSPYANSWEVKKVQTKESPYTTMLSPLLPQPAEVGIGLSEDGRNQNYHLFYAVGLHKAGNRKPDSESLRSELRKMRFKKSVGPAYYMHKYLDYRTGTQDFLMHVASDPVDLAKEILGGLWIVFEQINSELFDANITLSKP